MKHDPSILILFFISFDLAYFSYGLYKFSVLLLLLNSPIRFSNIIYSIFLSFSSYFIRSLGQQALLLLLLLFILISNVSKQKFKFELNFGIHNFIHVRDYFPVLFFCKFPSNFVIILILLLGQQQQQTDTIDFHHMHFLSISNGKKKNSLKWEKNSVLNIFCIFNFVLLCLFVWKYTFVEEKIN